MSIDQAGRGLIRKLLSSSGHVSSPGSAELVVRIPSKDTAVNSALEELLGMDAPQGDWVLFGAGALDLLGALFEENAEDADPELLLLYERWCVWSAETGFSLRVARLQPDAVLPKKERISDSGYDLTLIAVRKTLGQVTLYGTGLVVEPPPGWYLDVVARSSIIKTGHMLANNVGVIDRAYRGEVMVPVVKVDPDAPDLSLPVRLAQLIPRKIAHFRVEEADQLTLSTRGAGGFGSTG